MHKYLMLSSLICLRLFSMQDKATAGIIISKAWVETSATCKDLVLELPNGDRYIYTMLLGTTADHGQVSEKTNPTFEQRRTATSAELNEMRRIYNEYCNKYKNKPTV